MSTRKAADTQVSEESYAGIRNRGTCQPIVGYLQQRQRYVKLKHTL